MLRIPGVIKLFAISVLSALWILPPGAAAAGREVPGRVVVRLTERGAAQLRKGTFRIPVPGDARSLVKPSLTPLFSQTHGPLSCYAVLTWDLGAAEAVPELAENADWIRVLTQDPQVESAEADGWVALSALPQDPLFGGQFQLWNPGGLSLKAADAWPFVSPDQEVVVAILDSGVDWPHPDLGGPDPHLDEPKGVFWLNPDEAQGVPGEDDDLNGMVDDFIGWDFVDVPAIPPEYNAPPAVNGEDGETPDNNPMDYSGHGTYCAGLVTALSNNGVGISGHPPNVRLMPVRVAYQASSSWGSGIAFFSWFSAALVYAADAGADVASLSFHTDFYPQVLADAVHHAIYEKGMSIVNAAGNYSTSNIDQGQAYLASQPEVIAVAGVHPDGHWWSGSNYGDWVNIAAFARGMPSTYQNTDQTNYSYLVLGAGTSWACPQVAGGVALIRLAAPELGPLEVMDALVTTGQDLSSYGTTHEDELGGGLADFPAAIEKAGGGWVRALSARGLTPLHNGLVAVTAEGEITVRDAATAEERFTWKGQPVMGAPPCVLMDGADQVLAFASATPEAFQVRLVDDLGQSRPGWPHTLSEEPAALAAVRWGEGGTDALAVLAGSTLTVWKLDGSELLSDPDFEANGLVIGDLNSGTSGEEIAGYGAGHLVMRSPNQLTTTFLPEFDPGNVQPAAVEWTPGHTVVFAAMGSQLHAFDGGVVERAGFPVELGSDIQYLSVTGYSDGSVYALAADAAGVLHRVDPSGNGVAWSAMSTATGEVLAADLNGNFASDLILSLADGSVVSRTRELARTPNFPRSFPQALAGTPAVLDHPDGKRYLTAFDEDGRVWSLPVRRPETTPLVWSAARGSERRTALVTFAEATPVLTAALTWEWDGPGSGTVCWSLPPEVGVESFWVETGSVSVAVDGAATCAEVGVNGGEVVLRARLRDNPDLVELGRLRIPPFVGTVLSATPNPFVQGARLVFAPAPPGSEMEIFDVRGRLLRRDPVPAGARSLDWDGRDGAGRDVSPGVYFVRLVQPGSRPTQIKVVRTP